MYAIRSYYETYQWELKYTTSNYNLEEVDKSLDRQELLQD